MSKIHLKPGSTLGTFSKGNGYAISLNFGLSAGQNCDLCCAHNPKNPDPNAPKDCYAVRLEQRGDRQGLLAKLQRHEELSPLIIIGKAVREIKELKAKGQRIDWLRISTNGALPQPEAVEHNHAFRAAFRMLLNLAKEQNIKVHIPVETKEKQQFYQNMINGLGVVRESIHLNNEDDWHKFIYCDNPCSTSVGNGLKLIERIEMSQYLAKLRKEKSGRHTIVCPAVVASFKARMGPKEGRAALRVIANKSKCGNCIACSKPEMDIIYPAH